MQRNTERTLWAKVNFPKINLSQWLRKHPRGEPWVTAAAAPLAQVNARSPTWKKQACWHTHPHTHIELTDITNATVHLLFYRTMHVLDFSRTVETHFILMCNITNGLHALVEYAAVDVRMFGVLLLQLSYLFDFTVDVMRKNINDVTWRKQSSWSLRDKVWSQFVVIVMSKCWQEVQFILSLDFIVLW